MSVGQVSSGAEAERLKPRENAERKKVERAEPKPGTEATSGSKTDRVEISHEAKSLLQNMVNNMEQTAPKLSELTKLEERFLKRLWAELEKDLEVRDDRIAEVRQKLREAFYDRPEVLLDTSKRILEDILGIL